jgi:hypothetical protein
MLVGNLNAGPYSHCAALDKYRLPRAIVHVENRSFVAWIRAFLRLTGFSDDQLWSLNAKDCVTLWNPVADRRIREAFSLRPTAKAPRCELHRCPLIEFLCFSAANHDASRAFRFAPEPARAKLVS